jgi:hypothetical protein
VRSSRFIPRRKAEAILIALAGRAVEGSGSSRGTVLREEACFSVGIMGAQGRFEGGQSFGIGPGWEISLEFGAWVWRIN